MLKEVCAEFILLGFKQDLNPRTKKLSFNIEKHPNGHWLKSNKSDLHSPASREILNLEVMPELKKLTQHLDTIDSVFKKEGGRIFISEYLVFQIKKGTEYPMVSELPVLDKNQKYSKVIEELLNIGHERDRFRIEETYLLTKSPKGEWSATTNHENFAGKKIVLDLLKMPNFKSLSIKINKYDSLFESHGGRIFITPTRVYRIKNQVEIDLF